MINNNTLTTRGSLNVIDNNFTVAEYVSSCPTKELMQISENNNNNNKEIEVLSLADMFKFAIVKHRNLKSKTNEDDRKLKKETIKKVKRNEEIFRNILEYDKKIGFSVYTHPKNPMANLHLFINVLDYINVPEFQMLMTMLPQQVQCDIKAISERNISKSFGKTQKNIEQRIKDIAIGLECLSEHKVANTNFVGDIEYKNRYMDMLIGGCLWIEYDEEHHQKEENKKKDMYRENIIWEWNKIHRRKKASKLKLIRVRQGEEEVGLQEVAKEIARIRNLKNNTFSKCYK